jgi:hypothetical protein
MRRLQPSTLIIGASLLFAPACSGEAPTVGTACEAGATDCDDDTKTGYTCTDGKWVSSDVSWTTCECFEDPSTSGCAVIGYVGIDAGGAADARPSRGVRLRARNHGLA